MDKQELWQKIIAYKKILELRRLMEIKRIGGVSRSMLYKAFDEKNIQTPLSSLVIETAKEMIENHELQIKNNTAQMSAV